MLINKIIFLVAILTYYAVESKEDAILSGLGQSPKENRMWHITSAALLAIMLTPLIYILFGFTWLGLIAVIYSGVLRMSFFNILLNKQRGKPWYHLGTAGWDGLFKKYEKKYHITVVILAIITTILFLWI